MRVLSLALGIGANTAIFGLIDALLHKSLPIRDPQSLLFIAKQAQSGVDPAFYYETYQRLRAEQPFFQELAAYGDRVRMNVSVNGVAESTMGQLVSGNYYAVLGVPPASGRVFTPDDDRVGELRLRLGELVIGIAQENQAKNRDGVFGRFQF